LGQLKIALLSEEYPPFTFGGIGSVCHDLANALSRKGISTTVFCGRAEKMTIEKPTDNLKIIRLPCFDLPPRFLWFQLQNIGLLSRLLKDYSVLHIVNPEIGPVVLRTARALNKPTMVSIHGSYVTVLGLQFRAPVAFWQMRDIGASFLGYPIDEYGQSVCLSDADHIAICSHSTLAELKTNYPKLRMDKVSVIHNGINMADFHAGSEESQDEGPLVVSYGRLFYHKGFTYLLEAIARIHQDFPGLRVQIFGKGPMEAELARTISKLGIEDKLQIVGFVPRIELMRRIRKASIIVFPSLHEAQSVAVLEAMASGKTVVAFDIPSMREVIKDETNGLLARPEDVDDLSAKIRTLLSNDGLRLDLGKNAADYVRREHNWDVIVEEYINLYTNLERYSA
jgi:glycosyltransferase involved in cell wall biosynthesis